MKWGAFLEGEGCSYQLGQQQEGGNPLAEGSVLSSAEHAQLPPALRELQRQELGLPASLCPNHPQDPRQSKKRVVGHGQHGHSHCSLPRDHCNLSRTPNGTKSSPAGPAAITTISAAATLLHRESLSHLGLFFFSFWHLFPAAFILIQ